jgi:DNA-binding CsgD family transcriptional regulator
MLPPALLAPQPSSRRQAGDMPAAQFVVEGHRCTVVELRPPDPPAEHCVGMFEVAGRRFAICAEPLPAECPDPLKRLSPRELEIGTLIACGCSVKAIALRLDISCHTVKAHLGRCLAKLGLHKSTELAACVARRVQVGGTMNGAAPE